VEVGKISNVTLDSRGVWLELTLQKKYQNWITDSAKVFAIRDQNVISSRVVNVEVARAGNILNDGDTITAGQAQDLETVLETANELLSRVGDLVDVVDTIVTYVMDTSTTLGALLGSKSFYTNISTQLTRLDNMTRVGSHLLYSLDGHLPILLSKTDTLVGDLQTVVTGVKDIPTQLNGVFNSMDGMFNRMDTLMTNFDGVANSLSGFIEVGEKTLYGADEMVEGISNMWIIRRSMPQKDSVPFTVETLW
jgi:phospholipid/cholesterol/gamma-HCH transport system substrate-binding protein